MVQCCGKLLIYLYIRPFLQVFDILTKSKIFAIMYIEVKKSTFKQKTKEIRKLVINS